MNLTLLLDMAADTAGDRIAVGSRRGGRTFAALREQAHAVAVGLRGAGLERLVLAAENTDDLPGLVFGSAYAGAVFTAVNYRLADDRLRSVVQRCTPAAVVADERTAARIAGIDGLAPLTAGRPGAELPVVDSAGVAIALFTSGTSGDPKTVLLRHTNLTSYVISTTEFLAADEGEAALVSVPPYHIAGMAAVLSNVYLGRRMVYLPAFEAAEWVRIAREEEITHAMIVPTMLARILDVLEGSGTRLPHLRHLSYGGGRMPQPVVRRALELLPDVDFVNAYGLTETSSTIALLGPEDHRAALSGTHPDVTARLGSVGRALPGVDLEIRDAHGHRLAPGLTGEIVVRGDQVAGEYDGNDAKDAEGWFRTNDHGYLDAAGYLFIDGRADDVIVRGGENLSPGEIEDVLLQHPGVAEVAVVGMPSEEWGETVAAFVVPTVGTELDVDDVRDFVRSRLRSSRAPEVVHVREDLPYSETGKLLRRELRAELQR
ncbi:long-chain fatty acid--CoA ligase [Nocardioides mangrovicus]|uniref:Long-chain fatty acid--CoA ligase n=1 Tax=Nocardioides mangrovicus TaxID=2478913 RepID=A0A3L8NYJ8_9ACTN|nr:AMP-binding protein [Nocardioides mangrovicus]RLV47439.1 long-chain fatty acid--CoA ligase [Nocardioides mangrovicus]